ncbi:MAG TPA: pilus assembly PilX N-terminal domain-containing protein [Tepidisphaeraceae bacterium]|nr:pilus assembly PilX N-terminal domain-containing protein [Tepidisphaeraceae bacterium]
MPQCRQKSRAGVAYVLAMLYLMLFTVLAVGFCAGSAMSMQIARNDRSIADAQAAAESGMAFVRHELGHVTIPNDVSQANLAKTLADSLAQELDGSANLNGHSLKSTGNVIALPGENEWTTLDSETGTRFCAQLTFTGRTVVVKVTGRGRDDSISRAIQMEFKQSARGEGQTHFVAETATYAEVSP